MKTTTLLIALSLLPLTSFAGPGDGGGGKSIVCTGTNGTKTVYLADTFALARSGALKDLEPTEPRAIVAAAAKVVDKLKPAKIYPNPYDKTQKVSLGWMIAHRRGQLNFMPNNTPVPNLNDDNIDPKSLPAGCVKLQVAVQDIPKMRVDLAPEESQMSWAERGFLELHETLISLRNTPGADTTPIRKDVEEIATAMNAPNSPVRQQILDLIRAQRVPNQPVTKAMDDLGKYCNSYMADVKPQPNDTPKVARCRRISAEIIAQERLHDVTTSIPTVLLAPKKMSCLAGSQGDNPLHLKKPTAISITLAAGSGIPGGNTAENTFAIDIDGRKAHSSRSWFTTDRTMRESAFRAYGETNLQMFFKDGTGKTVTVFLRNYDDFTGTFDGTLQYADPTKLSFPNDSWFGLSCYAGKLPMGLDLENSRPSQRNVKAPPTPISQIGCDHIMMADVTRAQYLHDQAVLHRMYLQNPSNYLTVRRWKQLEREFYKDGSDMDKIQTELDKLEKTPVVQQFMKVRVLDEEPYRCIDFRGE